jgi:hypothetical protein
MRMLDRTAPSLQRLTAALHASWGPDTDLDPSRWSADNPARGQCVVSSLVVQDYYGGDFRRYRTHYEGHMEMHYCNILPDGTIIDTTASQYQTPVTLEILPIDLKGFATIRDKRLADDETSQRYEILKLRVAAYLAAAQTTSDCPSQQI